jgi:hypothetical protein
MRTCVLVIALALNALPSTAQQSSSPTVLKQNPDSGSHTAGTTIPSVTAAPSLSTPDQEKIQELTHRVQMLELQAAQRPSISGSSWIVAIITSIIGAAAVFSAAYVAAKLGVRSQLIAAGQAATLARDESLYRSAEQILEFRMKQVQHFYAPMFALLRQSKDLYDKMLEQLVEDDPARYRKVPNPVGKDFRWEVLDKQGKWQGFRLLDQLPAVKKQRNALAVADTMLAIGEKICKVISSRAGYASEDLVEMLGQYMAHFAILSTVRNGPETEPFEPGWHKVGYYPFGLDKKIADAYKEISKSIDEYGRACTQKLEILTK